jgi:hypothetical protein
MIAAGQGVPVGAERHCGDEIRVAEERSGGLPGRRVRMNDAGPEGLDRQCSRRRGRWGRRGGVRGLPIVTTGEHRGRIDRCVPPDGYSSGVDPMVAVDLAGGG